MSQLIFANNAISTLAGPISSTATSLSVAAGTGILFPQPSSGQYFTLTLISAGSSTTREVVHVTAVSTDTFTVTRAQEGTAALAWNAGDTVDHRITALWFQAMSQSGFGAIIPFTSSGTWTVPAGVTVIKNVRAWGGGGGGGGTSSSTGGAGGGASGQYSEASNIAVTPAQLITITIGSGGAAGAATPTSGTAGGASSFGSYCSAGGGAGGLGSSGVATTVAAGGSGGTGALTINGNNGGTPIGPLQTGAYVSGAGGGAPFAGSSSSGNQGAGSAGNFPGGGGNGGAGTWAGQPGGAGAPGFIVITY